MATRLNPRNNLNRSILDTELGPGEKWTGLEKQGMDWNGSAELDWTGLEQEGMDCAGSVRVDWTGLDWTAMPKICISNRADKHGKGFRKSSTLSTINFFFAGN